MSVDETRESRPIVVGIDGSVSSMEALAWAGRQAAFTGAPIHAVTAWEYPTNYGWAQALPADLDLAGDARTSLHRAVIDGLGEKANTGVTECVVEGHAAPTLVEHSKTASLVVVGCRGHGGFAGMLLGSVSAHVVAHAHCPVAVVHEHD